MTLSKLYQSFMRLLSSHYEHNNSLLYDYKYQKLLREK